MSGDDTRDGTPGEGTRGNDEITGKGHLRDGHLRKGHLRGNESSLRSIQGGAGGVNVDLNDDSFSVPDLLATDALLDRLGRHEASDGDLRDTVARILDAYALNADPETAGVRPVELPEIDAASAFVAQPETAPRVLLAHRRTLTRLGRGTVAAAAVLALLGGTAAAAATGAGSLGGNDTGASTSFSAQLPGWFPDTVFRAFGGTPEERIQREIDQAKQEFRAGESDTAKARLQNLQKQLGETDSDVDVTLAGVVQETLDQIENDTVALPTPTTSPSGSNAATGSPSPSTTTSLADVASTATPTDDVWKIPQKPRTAGSDTATGTPTTAPTTAPSAGAGSGGSVATTPPKTTTGSVPNVPVVPVTPSGPVVTPSPTDTPTDSPTTAPTETTPTETTPTETTPTETTPTDTPPAVVPTGESTTGAPTTEPTTGTTVGETPGTTPEESPTTTDPIEVVTPTLPVVVEPSPSAGAEPTPGADDASTTAPAGS